MRRRRKPRRLGHSTFAERKAYRTEYYLRFVFGWKLRPCSACCGSGHYDHDGSPPCGACDGTGNERYNPATSSTKATTREDPAC